MYDCKKHEYEFKTIPNGTRLIGFHECKHCGKNSIDIPYFNDSTNEL